MDFPLITGEQFHGAPLKASSGDDIIDLSGYGRDLTADTITQTTLESGRIVNVYDGADGRHTSTTLSFPSFPAITVIVWACADFLTTSGNAEYMITGRLNASNQFMIFNTTAGTWRFQCEGNNSTSFTDITDATLAGDFHQWAFRASNGTKVASVVDATEISQGSNNYETMTGAMTILTVGSDSISGSYWTGRIDPEILIYDYALSDEQMAQEYNRLCHYFGRAKI